MNYNLQGTSKSSFAKTILWCEGIGFLLMLTLLWLNEILDIPHYLAHAPATPINTKESVIETVMLILLSTVIMYATHRLVQRIKYLEGLLPICSACKKIRIGDEWEPVESYISKHSEAVFSHGICPDCARKLYGYSPESELSNPNATD